MTGRAWTAVALACACAALFGAIAPGRAALPARYGGELTLILTSELRSLDPVAAAAHAEVLLARQVFQPLWTLDEQKRPVPVLARGVDVGDNTIRVTLREAAFSDGTAVTAAAVAASLVRTITSSSPPAGLLTIHGAHAFRAGGAQNISGLRVTGVRDLELQFDGAPGPLLAAVDETAALIALDEGTGKEFRFTGTGPFRPVLSERGTLLLAANPRCPGGRPYLDRLVVRHGLSRQAARRLFAARGGQAIIDDAPDLPGSAQYAGVFLPGQIVALARGRRTLPFDAERLMPLIDAAIDRDSLARVILRGNARPLPGEWAASGTALTITADVELVIGVPMGRYGRAFEEQLQRVAERVQINLIDLGFHVTLQPVAADEPDASSRVHFEVVALSGLASDAALIPLVRLQTYLHLSPDVVGFPGTDARFDELWRVPIEHTGRVGSRTASGGRP